VVLISSSRSGLGIAARPPAYDELELTVSLGTAAVLTAVFAPLTTYLYGRK
jgi:hypothetical protein